MASSWASVRMLASCLGRSPESSMRFMAYTWSSTFRRTCQDRQAGRQAAHVSRHSSDLSAQRTGCDRWGTTSAHTSHLVLDLLCCSTYSEPCRSVRRTNHLAEFTARAVSVLNPAYPRHRSALSGAYHGASPSSPCTRWHRSPGLSATRARSRLRAADRHRHPHGTGRSKSCREHDKETLWLGK